MACFTPTLFFFHMPYQRSFEMKCKFDWRAEQTDPYQRLGRFNDVPFVANAVYRCGFLKCTACESSSATMKTSTQGRETKQTGAGNFKQTICYCLYLTAVRCISWIFKLLWIGEPKGAHLYWPSVILLQPIIEVGEGEKKSAQLKCLPREL